MRPIMNLRHLNPKHKRCKLPRVVGFYSPPEPVFQTTGLNRFALTCLRHCEYPSCRESIMSSPRSLKAISGTGGKDPACCCADTASALAPGSWLWTAARLV